MSGNTAPISPSPAPPIVLPVPQPRRTKDFGFLPIPRRVQYDPDNAPFEFTMLLNGVFAAAATFSVSNLYYLQPILVETAAFFKVTDGDMTRALTLVQLGYFTALLLVAPLADIVRRRGLILILVFSGATLTIAQALTKSFAVFQAFSYFVGVCTVIPQIMNPLAADLAPPHKRAAAVSIVITGLITGMLFGRITAGLITRFSSSFKNVYWMAVGLQYAEFLTLWWMLPDYPEKQKGVSYFQILKSMVRFVLTEPILIQAMIIGVFGCGIFVSWWTNLTFLLTDAPFHYDPFKIGLFALCGLVSIVLAPQLGRLTDRLNPWAGTLLGLSLHLLMQVIAVAAAKYSLGPIIIVCIFVDVAQQLQQIGNQVRVYSIDPLSRGRLNGCYGAAVFIGQLLGSSAGPKVYLSYGWRACFGMSAAWAGAAILVLCLRGPFAKGAIGWSGVYSIRKAKPSAQREEVEKAEEEEKTVVEEPRSGEEASERRQDLLEEVKSEAV